MRHHCIRLITRGVANQPTSMLTSTIIGCLASSSLVKPNLLVLHVCLSSSLLLMSGVMCEAKRLVCVFSSFLPAGLLCLRAGPSQCTSRTLLSQCASCVDGMQDRPALCCPTRQSKGAHSLFTFVLCYIKCCSVRVAVAVVATHVFV